MSTRRDRRSQARDEEEPRLQTTIQDAKVRLEARISEGNNLLGISIPDEDTLKDTKAKYYSWNEYNRTLLERLFTTGKLVKEYSSFGGAVVSLRTLPLAEQVQDFQGDVKSHLRRLESIRDRLELYEDSAIVAPSPGPSVPGTQKVGSRLFIVHGHDEGARESVARFITDLGLEPVILNEEPNQGATLIEKLERHRDIGFALVLLTPDDIGGARDTEQDKFRLRARQNVVLELGYFLGALGRNKVCTLYKPEIEMPTDFVGSGYISIDEAGAWKLPLARELKSSGFAIDLNKVL